MESNKHNYAITYCGHFSRTVKHKTTVQAENTKEAREWFKNHFNAVIIRIRKGKY